MADKFSWHGKAVEKEIRDREYKALARAGAFLEKVIKKSMTDTETRSGHGLLRQKARGKKRAKYHYPSLPGYPPAVDTGRLRGSITFQVSDGVGSSPQKPATAADTIETPSMMMSGATCRVGTAVHYGVYLEFGTKPRGRNSSLMGIIKPRPFLRPALENNRSKIIEFFEWKGGGGK